MASTPNWKKREYIQDKRRIQKAKYTMQEIISVHWSPSGIMYPVVVAQHRQDKQTFRLRMPEAEWLEMKEKGFFFV